MVMMAGKGPLPAGLESDAVKLADLPATVTATVSVLPESVPLTLSAGPGKTPSSYCCLVMVSVNQRPAAEAGVTATCFGTIQGKRSRLGAIHLSRGPECGSTYMMALTSWARQSKSALVATLAPSANWNGLGRGE